MTNNTSQEVKFTSKGIAVPNGAYGVDPRTGKPFIQAVLISYADSKNHAIYLDVPLEEAKQRFERAMNERSDFEIQDEGWEADVMVTYISDEIFLCTNFGDQAANLNEMLMKSITKE